ncbi:MAG TPA: serine hydrolase [Methylovirgula sp.]|nr:serine hydrolase [Methylovirgula sp.]
MADAFFAAPSCGPAIPDFATTAEALVNGFVAADQFAGVVLVASGDAIHLRQAFGLADREWQTAHRIESKFRLGSLTKQFTAAAILQLMEKGALSLDDPITRHYSAAPEAWRHVHLMHLLTHTSGIPSYTSQPGFFEKGALFEQTPEEIIALTRELPLLFQPGTHFKYNNGGYVLLGHVIERLTGQTYESYLQQNLLRPLGLDDTGYEHTDALIPFRARGYRFANGGIENATYIAMSVPYAAGSVYSTADDLLAWLKALKQARPLNASSVALMIADHGQGYGMGFAVQSQFGHRHLVHAGGINGFSVVLSHYPETDTTFLVLANIQGAPVQKIARDLAAVYFGADQTLEEVTLDPALLADYVGTYALEGKRLRVSQKGARLFAEWAGQIEQEMIAEDDHHFRAKWSDWSLSFEADGVALASRATLTLEGRSWSGPRVEE